MGFNAATGTWEDELGRNWNNAVRFSIPDLDVFQIDADANPPVETASVSGVGTVLSVGPSTPAGMATHVFFLVVLSILARLMVARRLRE